MSTDEMILETAKQSESLRQMTTAVTTKLGLDHAIADRRMREAVDKLRTLKRGGGLLRASNEDAIRHAIKQEFKPDFFAAARHEGEVSLTVEASMKKFREITKDLNEADRGNMMETFLAERDPGSARQVYVKKADLVGATPGSPRIPVARGEQAHIDRYIDRVRQDGTAVEVKSGGKKLSAREEVQFDVLSEMSKNKMIVQVKGQPIRIEKVVYQLTDPTGVRANIELIMTKVSEHVHFEVFNESGSARLIDMKFDQQEMLQWLTQ